MNLLVDIGNTFTHIGFSVNSHIANDFKFPTQSRIAAAQILKRIGGYKRRIKHAAISSVVPEKTAYWKEFVSKYFSSKPLIVSTNIPLPIVIKSRTFHTIGSDRICSAVGAYFLFEGKSNVIAIDLGTATTYNVVLKNGRFAGGVISPGIETSAKTLHLNTGKLPMLKPRQFLFPPNLLGRNTLEAMQSGLMNAAVFSINGMIRQIEKDFRGNFNIVLTGGNARRMISKIEHKTKFERFLVLQGLDRILEYNLMVYKS